MQMQQGPFEFIPSIDFFNEMWSYQHSIPCNVYLELLFLPRPVFGGPA